MPKFAQTNFNYEKEKVLEKTRYAYLSFRFDNVDFLV